VYSDASAGRLQDAVAASKDKKKETDMSGVIVFALEMGVVALVALAIYMVMKK